MMNARLFDVSTRTQIEVTGRDRVKFLHSFCTNDIKKLQPGQGCEAFITNVNGKVLGHIFVFAERDSLWLESVAGSAATLLPHLDRYLITEDVQFTDRSAEFMELLIAGPQSTEFLERLGLHPVTTLPLYGHMAIGPIDSFPVRSIRRVDWLDSPTWLLLISRDKSEAVQRTLPEFGLQSANADEFHARRIAAGFPLYGIDITEENLAQEVGRTELAISFTKGCYLGQEPIARIDAMGHVNRQLCRVELSSGPLPTPGTPILDKPTPDSKQVGAITSSAGTSESAVALAYLRTAHSRSGTQVFVDGHEGRVL
ncbi:MAG: YgfZ/GcvT domain-containing protein [Planctomycetaceae bacterium]